MDNKKELINPVEFFPTGGSKFIRSPDQLDQEKKNTSEFIKPVQFEERHKDFEDKVYIILYYINGDNIDDVNSRSFSVCHGRTMAYEDIKEKLESGLDIDVHRSKILTETKQTETKSGDIKYFMIPFEDAISVYAFCISVRDFYIDDGFDIEDYASGDIPEDDNKFDRAYLTSEQIAYRNELEDRIQRQQFINDMRQIYASKDNNVVEV